MSSFSKYNVMFSGELTKAEEEQIASQTLTNVRKDEDKKLGGMHEDTRTMLEDFYHRYNEDLAAMLSDTRFVWRDNYRERNRL